MPSDVSGMEDYLRLRDVYFCIGDTFRDGLIAAYPDHDPEEIKFVVKYLTTVAVKGLENKGYI